jgi:hypothetical protein
MTALAATKEFQVTADGKTESKILSEVIKKMPAAGFTEEEVQTIKLLVPAVQAMRAFGKGFRIIVVTLGLVAAGMAAWDQIVTRIKAWLLGE